MGLLYKSELQDSVDWVGQNAEDILKSVKNADGWAKVFPKGVPGWLHKLRNYFNVEPVSLTLVGKLVTDHWMQDVRSHGKLNSFVGKRALTGDVYFDEEVEVWYQMSAGGTIYHWGRDVRVDWAEAAYTQKVRGQEGTPIFKLVCPDGTGGSKETIVRNSYSQKKIGKTNKPQLVLDKIVVYMKHQGSYNFAETSVVGLDEHEKYDVNPHKKDADYIDPPDRFEPLNKRIFNEFVLTAAGAKTKREKRDISADFDEPPMRTMRK